MGVDLTQWRISIGKSNMNSWKKSCGVTKSDNNSNIFLSISSSLSGVVTLKPLKIIFGLLSVFGYLAFLYDFIDLVLLGTHTVYLYFC